MNDIELCPYDSSNAMTESDSDISIFFVFVLFVRFHILCNLRLVESWFLTYLDKIWAKAILCLQILCLSDAFYVPELTEKKPPLWESLYT